MVPKESPEGPQKSLRITKNQKNKVLMRHLSLIPQKTPKLCDFWHRKCVILGVPGTCKIKLRLERERHFHIFTQSRKSREKAPKMDPQISTYVANNRPSLLASRPSLPQTPSIYRLRSLPATSITRLGAFRHPPPNHEKSRSGHQGVLYGAP